MKPIWIIDDDKSIRWVFEKALARTDMEFKTFASVPEALNALNKEEPQVVVSDIRMPNGSGLDFLQEIKQRLPDIPVIIMTAYSDLESAVAAFQGGAFEYLAKPFDVDQAIEIIRRAVDESMRQATETVAIEETPEIIGQAPAKNWLPARCIATAHAQINPLSRSTLQPFPRTCWNQSFLAMSVVLLLARKPLAAGVLSRPMEEHYFWMKSAICHQICKPACCACCAMVNFTALAGISQSRSMCGLLPPPIKI